MVSQYQEVRPKNIYILAIVNGLSGLFCIFICIYMYVTIKIKEKGP